MGLGILDVKGGGAVPGTSTLTHSNQQQPIVSPSFAQ